MKEFSNNNDIDIGQVIGFYDENDILQISSRFEVRDDSIVIDSNIHVEKKDIVDVIFVDLKKYEQLLAKIKELESDAHINEIKAQGISEAIKGFRTFAISNNGNVACEDFDEYLCEQVNKLIS